jgi:hypothetical protein
MCDQYGWPDDSPIKTEARADFKDALVQEFNRIYGKDENDVASWQVLCRVLNVVPLPEDLEACRRVSRFIDISFYD